MPQMAPMSWLYLFIYFILMFLTFNSINYYLYLPMLKMKFNYKIISNYWKW
uniref:ATP synthase complex subunit 8 n=1 Tax=Lamprigera yunnana TaxID=370605 RepID=A0A5C0PWK7_9COLE|nr:ATP synthase F0 subunit 8 [Lamprigera yunnana]QEJ81503.1 ATP synthase F0 subunit 8 [Lamprigera yunnana]